jgi:hypothetical protein
MEGMDEFYAIGIGVGKQTNTETNRRYEKYGAET